MRKYVTFHGKTIRYIKEGNGAPVIFLLHGYLETLEVWHELAKSLSKHFTVIRMDIPGHGESEVIGETHSMELLAEAVHSVLQNENVSSFTLVGHSLGGYVSLAFLEAFPNLLNGLVLFHSHPFADAEPVKENREQEIGIVQKGEKRVIVHTNIPKMFANENLQTYQDKIENMRREAMNIPGEGIIAKQKGMIIRKDRSELLQNSVLPFMLIAGKKDNYINYDQVIPRIPLPAGGELITLDQSGHIGFVEERERAIQALDGFVLKNDPRANTS